MAPTALTVVQEGFYESNVPMSSMQEMPDAEGAEGDNGVRSNITSTCGDTKMGTEDQFSHHGDGSEAMQGLSRSSTTVVSEDDAETESERESDIVKAETRTVETNSATSERAQDTVISGPANSQSEDEALPQISAPAPTYSDPNRHTEPISGDDGTVPGEASIHRASRVRSETSPTHVNMQNVTPTGPVLAQGQKRRLTDIEDEDDASSPSDDGSDNLHDEDPPDSIIVNRQPPKKATYNTKRTQICCKSTIGRA
jgi:hypothetical protein